MNTSGENVAADAASPRVSIIIPTYNTAQHIQTAIESIERQTYQNIEIIVVDDGSTDGTANLLKSLIDKKRIRYVYQENSGASAARNTGIRKATGCFIGFLDADDEFDISMVSSCVEELAGSHYDLVSVDSYRIFLSEDTETGREEQEYAWIEKTPEELFLTFLKVGGIGGVHKAIFKNSVFDVIGYLDESLPVYEDLDFWIRISREGLNWKHLRRKLVFYKRRDDNKSLITRNTEVNQDCRIRILKKYKNEAIQRSAEMREILAHQMWNFGRGYIQEYNNLPKAINCIAYSISIQPSPRRLFKTIKGQLKRPKN